MTELTSTEESSLGLSEKCGRIVKGELTWYICQIFKDRFDVFSNLFKKRFFIDNQR